MSVIVAHVVRRLCTYLEGPVEAGEEEPCHSLEGVVVVVGVLSQQLITTREME